MPLIRLDEPVVRPKTPPTGFALFALGFRPFYLLAALFAALVIPLWIGMYVGHLPQPAYIPALWWHAHEMVFGFGVAIIVGFLFTAGQNWTGLPTPSGPALALIAALWLGGRSAMLFASPVPAAAVDIAFLPVAAIALGRVIWRAKSQRNYFTVALLSALAVANAIFHFRALGWLDGAPLAALHGALALIVMLMTIIAGRIVPNFTANALRGITQYRHDQLEVSAIGFTGCALALFVGGASAGLTATVALIAALLQGARTWGWNPWATRGTPLLWVLHLSHAWIVAGLVLIACASLGWVLPSLAWHAFGMGAMGGLILGMITRTALGHTGRLLQAGRIETAAYALLLGGALIRVFGGLLLPGLTPTVLVLAMLCWSTAFVLYVWKYAPMLIRPRIDGRKG